MSLNPYQILHTSERIVRRACYHRKAGTIDISDVRGLPRDAGSAPGRAVGTLHGVVIGMAV